MTPTALLPKEADYRTVCSITTTSLKLSPSFSFHISLALGWVQKPKRAKKKKKKAHEQRFVYGAEMGSRDKRLADVSEQLPGPRASAQLLCHNRTAADRAPRGPSQTGRKRRASPPSHQTAGIWQEKSADFTLAPCSGLPLPKLCHVRGCQLYP